MNPESLTMKDVLVFVYAGACFFYALALLLHLWKKRKLERASAAAGLVLNAMALGTVTLASGHLPVFNLFESLIFTAALITCLYFFFTRAEQRLPDLALWVLIEILLVLALALFSPAMLAVSRYDFVDPLVVCFFLFRVGALATILFSSACFIQARAAREDSGGAPDHFRLGRNFLLLGTIFFLASEYSGMVWCQNGWGDVWRWGGAHLLSVYVFLYLMLAFHIQEKKSGVRGIRSLVAGMSGVVLLALTVLRGLQ